MEIIEDLSTRIAGEISLSDDPWRIFKKWRELFGLTQSELAKYLSTSPSVVCDYESGRRRSPGTRVVKKFVSAVIQADIDKGKPFLRSYGKSHFQDSSADVIIDMREFSSPLTVKDLSGVLEGNIVSGTRYQDDFVFGYTIIDSIKAIIELSAEDFFKLYGTTTQRALVFTKVSYGRSPLIAVRVTSIKPKVIVMHGVDEIDPLGQKIARKERIPIILTDMELKVMINKLRMCAS